jgi:hypothetical protein
MSAVFGIHRERQLSGDKLPSMPIRLHGRRRGADLPRQVKLLFIRTLNTTIIGLTGIAALSVQISIN